MVGRKFKKVIRVRELRNKVLAAAAALQIFTSSCQSLAQGEASLLKWSQLPTMPDKVGLAGAFAGVSHGALVVAGGANFPAAMPWDGGKKIWHDDIFILPNPDSKWRLGFKLPRPNAYGVSITVSNGILCAGGSDEKRNHRDVFLINWAGDRIETKTMPPLPEPMAYGCGAMVGDSLYVAGGINRPDATNALRNFWKMDLSGKKPSWKKLDPWPGPARMLAVAGSLDENFYLFSGVELSGDSTGRPSRHYLRDAYLYNPKTGWKRLADLPRPVAGAPSPTPVIDGKFAVVSGDDGANVDFEPKSAHPGFPKDVLIYDPQRNEWSRAGDSLISRATVSVVEWNGSWVIPGGEVRPGVRTPEVWSVTRLPK